MQTKSLLRAGLLAVVLAGSAQAQAATIQINFDNVTTNYAVDQFYNGGVDGAGQSGVNYGVAFYNFVTTTGFGETSAPNLAYNGGTPAWADVAQGFTTLSFTSGAFGTAYVDVYSGLAGAGTLLGSTQLASDPSHFAAGSVSFAGVAHSFVLRGDLGTVGIDDVALTTPVPEPETYAMLLAGLGLLGVMARRRR